VRQKVASALGLLGFALTALVGALRGGDFAAAIVRAIVAACVMCLVGYVAGTIAERAVSEAVDAKLPLRPEPTLESLRQANGNKEEGNK